MAEIAALILEFIKCVTPPTRSCVDNHRNFKANAEDLRNKLRILDGRKEDVETRLHDEVCLEKQAKKEVVVWLQDVEKINASIQDVLKRVHSASYLSRARLGKLVHEKINAVDAILQRGSFPEGLVVNKPATALPLPVENLEGKVSVKEKIWGYLTGNEVQMIGVCGIGGVGKTTIMKHIHNELLLMESRFDKVIWVTVSYPLNVVRLQHEIAKAMNEKLPEDDQDEQRQASRLMHLMGRRKYVLILDDVWERFTLEHVGIPPPTLENECKIVITSREVEVCNFLGCKVVKVQPLSKQESLNLFLNKVGREILEIPELEGILKLMVDECAGLPLAIVVIAGSMKGVTDIHEWRHALNELRECLRDTAKGSRDEIFERLKFSYDRLQDSNIQNCFLFYSLYPEDHAIRKKYLVEQWIDEGLLKELGSRQAMFDMGQTILNRLENSCLLEKAYSEDSIKMHDVVRDMALRIKSIGPQFMVKARMELTKIPDEHEWTENLEKVSLMQNRISYIPLNMCPNCPNLTTLMLQGNSELTQIPDCFFASMQGLKFLDLSKTGIESLPNTIGNLVNLTTLLLRFCRKLKHVPCLEKLKALKKLDLYKAGIEVVPEGIEMLVNLQYLDLWCPELEELPRPRILTVSNLSHLHHLVVNYSSTSLRIKGEEVTKLKKLETFEAQLYDLQDFNHYVKSNHFKRLSNYVLVVGQVADGFDREFSKTISLGECEIGGKDSVALPDDVQELWIYRCKIFRSLSDIFSLQKTTKLRRCYAFECKETECVVDVGTSSSSFSNNLETLRLHKLPNFSVVADVERVEATPPHIFSNLKKIFWIGEFSKMKRLFPFELLQGLQNLEEITVEDCEDMEEITGWEGEEENHTANATTTPFTLPKLTSLWLENLPELKRICPSRGVMVCDSLQWLQIKECPKLRRIPLVGNVRPSPPAALKEILIQPKELWESLEWDDPNAKNVLQPFVYFPSGPQMESFALNQMAEIQHH